jgi:hypothetical protein
MMTAQVHERIILEGEERSMAFCPPIPRDHPRITGLEYDEVRKGVEAGSITSFIYSTACWRRYIGTWKLDDGRLYLVALDGVYRVVGDEPIFADWFTGVLRIPSGNMLHYVHMGFGSVYEFETHIKIENGVVIEERRIDNRRKDFGDRDLRWENLPGGENRFDGDDL